MSHHQFSREVEDEAQSVRVWTPRSRMVPQPRKPHLRIPLWAVLIACLVAYLFWQAR